MARALHSSLRFKCGPFRDRHARQALPCSRQHGKRRLVRLVPQVCVDLSSQRFERRSDLPDRRRVCVRLCGGRCRHCIHFRSKDICHRFRVYVYAVVSL